MTAAHWLVLPLVLHVLLTVAVGVLSLRSRIDAVRRGLTRVGDITLDNSKWPKSTLKLGNNFDNQFQVPLLAYAAVALIIPLALVDWVCVAFVWFFFVARLFHSFEHTGPNRIVWRMNFFLASYAFVVALWLWIALRFYVIG